MHGLRVFRAAGGRGIQVPLRSASSSRHFAGTTRTSACNSRNGAPSNVTKCSAGSARSRGRRWQMAILRQGFRAKRILRKIVSGNVRRELQVRQKRERTPCGCETRRRCGRAQPWRACNPQSLSPARRRRYGSRAEVALLRQHGHRVVEYVRDNAAIDGFGALRQASLLASTTWNQQAYIELREVIRAERPDVVHCHNLMPLISPAAYYACRAEGVPVVQTLHNFRLRCAAGTQFHHGAVCDDCRHGLGRAVARGCYRNSRVQTAAVALMLSAHRALGTWERGIAAYSAPSQFCVEQMAAGGIPRDKITLRPNFLLKDPGQRIASEDYVVFVGRLCTEKGVKQLLQCLEQAAHNSARNCRRWSVARRGGELCGTTRDESCQFHGRITGDRDNGTASGERGSSCFPAWATRHLG